MGVRRDNRLTGYPDRAGTLASVTAIAFPYFLESAAESG